MCGSKNTTDFRCTHFLPSDMESDHADWPVSRDHALVLYVDTLCRAWSTTPSRLMPDELLLSEVDLTSEDFHQLQGELTVSYKLYSCGAGIALFTVDFSHLDYNVIQRGCETISG